MNITKELAQALLNYLARQPYAEVFMLVGELQKQSRVAPLREEPKGEVKEEQKDDETN